MTTPTDQRGMDVSDRELLEAAAKAAGYANLFQSTMHEHWFADIGGKSQPWSPLADDGDALRLAVKMNFTIKFDTVPDGAVVKVSVPWHDNFDADYYWIEFLNRDAPAATRRAIVRAAAAIGKDVP